MPDADLYQNNRDDFNALLDRQKDAMQFIPKPIQRKIRGQFEAVEDTSAQVSNTTKEIERFTHSILDALDGGGRTSHFAKASQGIQYAHLGLVALDFIRLPFLLLLAKRQHKPIKFTASTKLRWLYGGVTAALLIVSFAFPPSALVISLMMAGLGLGESLWYMGKMLFKAIKLNRAIKDKDTEIEALMEPLNRLHQETSNLVAKINDSNALKEHKAEYQAELNQVSKRFNDYYEDNKNKIQTLVNERAHLLQKRNKINLAAIINKTIGLTLAAAAVCGAILSVIFPPLGLFMLAITGGVSCTYVIARFGLFIYSKIKARQAKAKSNAFGEAIAEPEKPSPTKITQGLAQEKKPLAPQSNTTTPSENDQPSHQAPMPLFGPLKTSTIKGSRHNKQDENHSDPKQPLVH